MHTECMTPETLKVAGRLTKIIQGRHFVLAGGTAAALHIGHRISVDLDLFTGRRFSNDMILQAMKLQGLMPEVLQEEEGTLTVIVNGVKISLFLYPYPFIEKTASLKGISVAGIIDIASMKVLAITQRGAKRDFVDLYFILRDIPFAKVAANMFARFGAGRINPAVIGKALVYFVDADSEPEPQYLTKNKDWKSIKKYFFDHVRQFTLDLQGNV